MPLRAGRFPFEHQDAGGDAGAVNRLAGRPMMPFEDAGAHQLLCGWSPPGVAREQHAVRQDAGGFCRSLFIADDVQQISVVALFGRRLAPRRSAEGIVDGSRPVLQVLSENGGLATT